MAKEDNHCTAGHREGEETLEFLLEASRTSEGRARLASTGTLAAALRRLSDESTPSLLPWLRLIRNLCAGETANQDAFVELGGPDRIASVLLRNPPAPREVVRVALQVLGNAAADGELHRSAVWSRFFPTLFLEVVQYREPAVCDPLCMVLDTCCSSEGGRQRLAQLCEIETGLPILLEIISTACGAHHKEDWFYWLLCKVCIEEPYFSRVFIGLGSPCDLDNSAEDECQYMLFTREQSFLLEMLTEYLRDRPGDVTSISNHFVLEVLKVLKGASAIVDFTSRGNSDVPTGSPAVDALGYSLIILRHICAWANDISHAAEAHIDSLVSAGLLQLLLCLLGELEPPAIIRKSMMNARGHSGQPSSSVKLCPYKGFRKDLVSVIANCLHGRKQVQDEIRRQKAISLLLQQCVVDEDNPLLREWGLWSIRNLLEENVENQQEVAELQLQEPVNTPEMDSIGLRVEIDEKTGRPKLVNIA
ncbi:ataxin-10 [Canna indica]|uniref:Ataxin-10 n=1 Tax=Canna indica TaxID=4628 RepID=A0AAQ3KN30_9LILI|nr:ataxin-10 [Canna indica]